MGCGALEQAKARADGAVDQARGQAHGRGPVLQPVGRNYIARCGRPRIQCLRAQAPCIIRRFQENRLFCWRSSHDTPPAHNSAAATPLLQYVGPYQPETHGACRQRRDSGRVLCGTGGCGEAGGRLPDALGHGLRRQEPGGVGPLALGKAAQLAQRAFPHGALEARHAPQAAAPDARLDRACASRNLSWLT